jgi:hypothetical protein
MDAKNLIELAESRFSLSEDERRFLAAIQTYQEIPPRSPDAAAPEASEEPAPAAPRPQLSAALLAWLCTDAEAAAQIPYWGLRIFEAQIEGALNLQYARIPFPLIFRQCCFTEAIRLECASLPSLNLSGSHLQGSQITDLSGEPITAALEAINLQVAYYVFLTDGFEAAGAVRLVGAQIGGLLTCSGGTFHNPDGDALNAQGVEIGQDVVLSDGFEAAGAVTLPGAKIGGQLSCIGGTFHNSNGYALNAQGAEIGDAVFFRGSFEAAGEVRLSGARIGGQLSCIGGTFHNPDGIALNAQGVEIGQDVILRDGFEAAGAVRLSGAKIGGQLDCIGGTFHNPDGIALNAQGVEIGQDVVLRDGFEATGVVWLLGAKIGGQLDCHGGTFHNPDGDALNAQEAEIGKSVVLRDGFEATGAVDLSFATARVLDDREEDWPDTLYLEGFTYDKLAYSAPVEGQQRLQWLGRQPRQFFSPQPYEQLATVLKASGHDEAATEVLIGQQNDRLRYANMHRVKRGLNRVLGVFIAHGYRSYRALYWAVGFIGVGTVLFQWGYSHPDQLITPSDVGHAATAPAQVSAGYPAFNALVYSADVFLPIIDLHQQRYWLPNANRGAEVPLLLLKCREGALLRWYFWAHIILGWILTSLWVAGFTGLVRRLE